jgi:hypothetical protein
MAGTSNRAPIDPAEVVARQHRARAYRDTVAASRAGEDEEVGVAVGWELPADGLDHQRGQRQLPDAGVALGAGFEAAAELAAGLVAHLDDLENGSGPIEVDPSVAEAGQLAEAQTGAEEDEDVIPPGQRDAAEQLAGFFGRIGAALGLPEQLLGVGAALGWRRLAHRVAHNGAFILGELEDSIQDGTACQQGLTADLGGQLGLPATNIGRADALDRSVAEPRPHMTPYAVLGCRQRGGAAVGVSGPHFPPVVRPLAERESPATSLSPGAAAHLQAFLGGEVAGLVGGVDRPAALGAVIQPPGDQVAVAALAPAHRPHQELPASSWGTGFGGPGRRGALAGRWAPLATGHDSRDGRERLGPFSLDNVIADLALTAGSPRCRHAPQNLQNLQNRPASEVL